MAGKRGADDAARPKTLRYGELDRALIVAAAMRIAERSGISGLTIRALATELNLSTTAVYHHVKDKRELLDLVAQETLAAIDLPRTGSWQTRLRRFARSARTSLLRIDGIAELMHTYPLHGAARAVDAVMNQIVVDAGLPPQRHEGARLLLMVFILGSVSFEQALDGHPHQLSVSPEVRFEQGLDTLIAGLDARGRPRTDRSRR